MDLVLLFDLDGTLTDSREGIVKSVRYALEKLSLPIPPEETLLRFIGPPLEDSFQRCCGLTEAGAAEAAVSLGWARRSGRPTPYYTAFLGRGQGSRREKTGRKS